MMNNMMVILATTNIRIDCFPNHKQSLTIIVKIKPPICPRTPYLILWLLQLRKEQGHRYASFQQRSILRPSGKSFKWSRIALNLAAKIRWLIHTTNPTHGESNNLFVWGMFCSDGHATSFHCAGPPDQLAAKEHLLSSAFRKVERYKNADQDKISAQCAYVYERFSVPWTNPFKTKWCEPQERYTWTPHRLWPNIWIPLMAAHKPRLPTWEPLDGNAVLKFTDMRLDFIRFFHPGWLGGIRTTYHSCIVHSMQHSLKHIKNICRSKCKSLLSSGFLRWDFYREGSIGGLRMALPLSLL